MLVLVYAASAVVTVRPITDPDIWWHLSTGRWVFEHGAVPRTDPFSAYGNGGSWEAYSWLFALVVYGLHEAFGLLGLVVYALLGGLAITSALLLLIMRRESRIPRVIALTGVAVAAMAPVIMPRAYLFTICFFIIELHLVLVAREKGRTRLLWLLPPLFVLWANLHIQFVYGIGVLVLALVESLVGRVVRPGGIARTSVPLRPLTLVAIACGLATLATPYGLDVYRSVIDYGTQRFVYDVVIELKAPGFRQPANWVFLVVVLAGAYTLGRQRPLELFPALLFAIGAYFSFATTRDMWFIVVVVVAIISSTWGDRHVARRAVRPSAIATVVAGVIVSIFGVAMGRHVSSAGLEAAVAEVYPVDAAAFVRARGYPGPLYNTFDWGGFLIWRLPGYPVSIDGRSNVHGDERVWRSVLTSTGRRGWDTDDELRGARLVILPRDLALTELLRRDPLYDVVYEDVVAAVFTRRGQRPESLGPVRW